MEEEGIYISPNEPEITAYAMIFSKDFKKYLYEHIFVGFESSGDNPLFNSREIQIALEIQNAIRTKNFEKYFEIL